MLAPSKLVKTSVSSTTHKSFKPFKPNLLKRKRKKVVEESLEVAGGEVVEEEEIATQVAPLDQPVKQVIPTVGKIIPQPVVEEEDDFQPEIQEISLKDLIEDQFKEGRLSTREIQRREKVKEKRRSKRKIDEVATTPTETVEIQSSQPKLIVVNGKMVLDQESIQIRNQVQMHEGDIIEEDVYFEINLGF